MQETNETDGAQSTLLGLKAGKGMLFVGVCVWSIVCECVCMCIVCECVWCMCVCVCVCVCGVHLRCGVLYVCVSGVQ